MQYALGNEAFQAAEINIGIRYTVKQEHDEMPREGNTNNAADSMRNRADSEGGRHAR